MKKPKTSKALPSVVAIGASAGGTRALKTLFSKVKTLENLIVLVIEHIDESGNELAAESLKSLTDFVVHEIKSGDDLKAGSIYFVPSHKSIEFKGVKAKLISATTTAQKLTVIDHAFISVAKNFGQHAIGIVLSGDGSDGSVGIKAIHVTGGQSLAQKPETADHPSMPESAIATGFVDHVLSPEDIWKEVEEYTNYLHHTSKVNGTPNIKDQIESALPTICDFLQQGTRHDFKHYKTSTLVRRIQRRMQVLQLHVASDYIDHLQVNKDEIEILFRELLINVTSFFRDPESFEALREEVLKPLLNAEGSQKIRIWVPGCSTGEEAYSIAIMIRELLDAQKNPREVQILATDLDDDALNSARKGAYSATIAEHVGRERLEKFFIKRGGKYHIKKEIRELCLFSIHNLVTDPPFSQLDLISCRNVLIYLGPHLQKKLFPVFHYALRANGYLFLGTSETLTSHKELFKPISNKHRIAQRKATAIKMPSIGTSVQNYLSYFQDTEKTSEADLGLIGQRIALDEMPLKYAIVNDEAQILFAAAGMNKYVQISEGHFQNNIVKLVTPELRAALRSAFNTAKKEKRKVTNDGCTIKTVVGMERTGVIVQPMPQLGDVSELYWIAFHNLGSVHFKEHAPRPIDEDEAELIDHLERELQVIRQELDKSVQDLEASNEELKSSNEELLSMNEELQSANEELETSKEDVQASNDALQRANSDLENLLASTQIATLFLDDEYRIRGFTPAIREIYNVEIHDVSRRISDFTSNAETMEEYPPISKVTSEKVLESEVVLKDGRTFLRRILPYTTAEGERDGLVVTFMDVTELRETEKRFQVMADSAPTLVWISGRDKMRTWFNKGWLEYTGVSMSESLGEGWTKSVHPEDLPRYIEVYDRHFEEQTPFQLDYRLRYHDGSYRWISARGVPRFAPDGKFEGFIGACLDIHEKKRATEALASSEAMFRSLVDKSPAMMWITDKEAKCTYLSSKWYKTTGRTPEQDLGYGWVENVHPADREEAGKAFFSAIESKGRISIKYRLRHADGSYRWAIDSGMPLIGPDGEFEGYIGTVVDIDDQIAATEALEELRIRFLRSVEATELGVWYCDLPFDELIWNKEVKNHFHMDPHQKVTIEEFYRHIHKEDRDMVRESIQHSIDAHSPYSIVYRTVDPKDETKIKWIRAIGWTDYDEHNHPTRFDGITLDVTTEHMRSIELQKAKEVADLASASKSRFLANMSHEIRTPLSAIVGFSELLQKEIPQDHKSKDFLHRIQRSSLQLRRLIDELLDLSKIEAGKLDIEHRVVDLDTLVADVFTTLELKAQEKGIVLRQKWSSQKRSTIVTDPVRLSQILINIIGNAVKFTEKGSVDVEFESKQDIFQICVKDTGIGLTAAQQKRIFEPFMQADSSVSRRFGGTGLGLALSKRLAMLLGGDIVLDKSVENQGSVFRIQIRDEESNLTGDDRKVLDMVPPQVQISRLENNKILIVDDSQDNRLLVNVILSETRATLSEAVNGLEAVDMAQKENFDLILMDIQMPLMDGYEALKKLKQMGIKTPVIALTAHAFREEKERCLKAGFAAYLTKPIDPREMYRVLSSMLEANHE